MKARAAAWKAEGLSIGLVPTMGSLHEGHGASWTPPARRATASSSRCSSTPSSSGWARTTKPYPRDLERDARICERHGVDVVFHPEVDDMYPGPQ